MVQILLVLKVLFTQDSGVEDLFCCASPGPEPSLFFSNKLFSLEFEPIQDDSQHEFTWMTDKANGSEILAELYVALFRECNNQRLSPCGWLFPCFPDLVTDICQNINHGLPSCLNMFCWYTINSCSLSLFHCSYCDLNFLTKDRLYIFFWVLTAGQNYIVSITLIVVHLPRISCSSVRHFPDLSWIVVALPCFSEDPLPVDLLSYCYFLFSQASTFIHWVSIQSIFSFLQGLFALLYSFSPSYPYHLFFKFPL